MVRLMLTKRSIVISTQMTSIGLENAFWDEVERQAKLQGMSWQEYARHLIRDAGDNENRSSFIRKKILQLLKEELERAKQGHQEASWTVRAAHRTYEIGTRGEMLYVGRDADNDIVINDESVSRTHLILCWDKKKWWALDLNSKNGMIVGGERVHATIVPRGMSLIIGDVEISLMN